jgi:hypothetical protein
MTRRIRLLVALVGLGLLGVLLVGVNPQAEEMEANEPTPVRDDEIELYIQVYSAMQDDHDLTIENAIRPHHISLENFRQIERHIQNQPRLVERVRQALLEHAKASSVFAQSLGTPTPGATPAGRGRGQRRR